MHKKLKHEVYSMSHWVMLTLSLSVCVCVCLYMVNVCVFHITSL